MARSPGVYGIGSSGEALADRPNGRATAPILDGERPSAIEADRSRRSGGLDLDGDDAAVAVLDDEIDLVLAALVVVES